MDTCQLIEEQILHNRGIACLFVCGLQHQWPDQSSELVHFIKQWVDEEFENGRVTFISADEMKKLIAEFKKTHECDL